MSGALGVALSLLTIAAVFILQPGELLGIPPSATVDLAKVGLLLAPGGPVVGAGAAFAPMVASPRGRRLGICPGGGSDHRRQHEHVDRRRAGPAAANGGQPPRPGDCGPNRPRAPARGHHARTGPGAAHGRPHNRDQGRRPRAFLCRRRDRPYAHHGADRYRRQHRRHRATRTPTRLASSPSASTTACRWPRPMVSSRLPRRC